MTDDKVLDERGWVALEHRNSNPRTVHITKNGQVVRAYTFTPQHNVSLIFAHPEDVDFLLRQQVKICCGKMSNLCHVATQLNVNLWKSGNREGVIS
jgi:hypothetical protein